MRWSLCDGIDSSALFKNLFVIAFPVDDALGGYQKGTLVRFGSQAACQANSSLMSDIGGKAAARSFDYRSLSLNDCSQR